MLFVCLFFHQKTIEEVHLVRVVALQCPGCRHAALSTLPAVALPQGISPWITRTQGACRLGRHSSMAPHNLDLSTHMVTRITSTITTITIQALCPLLWLSLSPAAPWRGPVPCLYPAQGSAPAPSTMTRYSGSVFNPLIYCLRTK